MHTHACMCDCECEAGAPLPCREVLTASGPPSAAQLCQNSYAGQVLKELKFLIARASRSPLCRNNYTSKTPFSLAALTPWCILYTSTGRTLAIISASRTRDTLLQSTPWISLRNTPQVYNTGGCHWICYDEGILIFKQQHWDQIV